MWTTLCPGAKLRLQVWSCSRASLNVIRQNINKRLTVFRQKLFEFKSLDLVWGWDYISASYPQLLFFFLVLGYLLFSCLWWVYWGTSGVAKSMELRGLKTDLTVGWSDWHQQYPVVPNPVVPSHWRVPVDLVKYSMDRWVEVSSCTHQYPTVQEPLLKYKVRSCFFLPWCETRIKCRDIFALVNKYLFWPGCKVI